jgi:hypothetical protein
MIGESKGNDALRRAQDERKRKVLNCHNPFVLSSSKHQWLLQRTVRRHRDGAHRALHNAYAARYRRRHIAKDTTLPPKLAQQIVLRAVRTTSGISPA